MAAEEQMANKRDRYKASSFRAYNDKLPYRYDSSIAVRFFQLSKMDDFVLDILGSDITSIAILDVGCATGRLLERLAEEGARKLTGSDLAPRILDVARGRLTRFNNDFVLIEADAETLLPWPAESFDVVILTGVVHHFCHPEAAFLEIKRVLRTDGKLIIADACFFPPIRQLFNLCLRIHPHKGDCHFFTRYLLSKMLLTCGWNVIHSKWINWCYFGTVAQPESSGKPFI